MEKDCFKLKHNKFAFNLVDGVIKSTNRWSESHVSGGGSSLLVDGVVNDVKTKVNNQIEFWIETDDGQERCYKVNADIVQLREGQRVRLVERNFKKKNRVKQNDLVLLYNVKQKKFYIIKNSMDMLRSEKSFIILLYFVFMIFGLMLAGSMLFLIYFLIIITGGIFLFKANKYYSNKIKNIECFLLEE